MLRKFRRNHFSKPMMARRNKTTADGRHRRSLETLEGRFMMAAHIAGSSTAYSTIQAAVNAAAPGATINVGPGDYAELVTVNKPLTIDGAQAGVDARSNARGAGQESIITGVNLGGTVSSAFYITASDVTIDGFTVQGNTSAGTYGAGIVIGPSQHGTHILDNIIQNNVTGLYLANNSSTDQAVIQYNLFLNNNNPGNNSGRGIYTDSGVSGGDLTNVLIDSNDFIVNHIPSGGDSYEGAVALEGRAANSQSDITITNNMMDGTGKLLIYNASNITIEDNVVTGQLDQWSGTLRFEGGCTNVTIEYNTVFDNRGPGVCIDSKGFAAEDSGFVIEYNNFYNNNTEYGNKLSLVATEDDYNGTVIATNNYWGSASGPGGQGPGTGDTIYGNGVYEKGANSGWSTVAGDEIVFSPWSTTPNTTLDTAYLNVPSSAGAPIQADNYDQGGNGIGYSTTATSNTSNRYRTAEDISIENCTDTTGNAFDVNNTTAGEWLDYAANLTVGGTYSISFRVATAQATGGTFNLDVDGQNVTGSITVPSTGGAQVWKTVTVSGIQLTAGSHMLRLMMDSNGNLGTVGSFNWLELTNTSVVTLPAVPTSLTATATSATSVAVAWNESSSNQVGFVIQRSTDGVNFTQIGTAAATATSYTDTAATGGVTYTYRIAATNAGGNSSWSGTASVTTPVVATAATALAAVAMSPTLVALSWTDTAAGIETGFLVERSTDGVNFTQIGTTAQGVTFYSDPTAVAGTTYTYEVCATSAGGNSAYSAIASTTTPAAGSIITDLSSLGWASATTGWGTVQKNLSVGGNPITLNGAIYATGIGTHAVSQIVYDLNGAYTNFISSVGIDAEEDGVGSSSVDFQVIGDGKVLFDSGVLTNASPTVNLDVNVSGVQQLTLVATNGVANSIDYDHADWAGAELLASAVQAPIAPGGLTATVMAPTQVNLAWANNAPNATSTIIQRSTDGVNFTQIGTVAAGVTIFDDTSASAATAYTYRVLAANTAGDSAPSNCATATTLSASAVVTYASSLPWVSATAGWGSVQLNTSVAGNPITLRGVTYAQGLGTHAASQIVYDLNGQYTNFISDVGIDDEEIGKGQGEVDFQVIGDGKVLFDSGVLTEASPIVSLDVNVTGVQQLTLVATNGVANDIDYDHSDWAAARLISAPVVAPAPAPAPAVQAVSVAPVQSVSTPAVQSVGAPATQSVSAATVLAGTNVGVAKPFVGPVLPAPWSNVAIGAGAAPGSGSESDGIFTVAGSGLGVGGAADSLDYVYESLTGNGSIVAHLTGEQSTSDQVGLMIRESSAASAKETALVLSNNAASFIHRAKAGAKVGITTTKKVSPPQWMKLSRSGNTFTGYVSVDGMHWTKVGSTSIKMNADVEIGMSMASGTSTLDSATFSDVSVV